ncbi:hypothetical protein D3C85_1652980 [compost metagenome]
MYRAVGQVQLYLDIRIALSERGDCRPDVRATKPQRRIDPQQPFGFGTATGDLALHFIDLAEDPLRVHQIELALRCEADAPGGAVQ